MSLLSVVTPSEKPRAGSNPALKASAAAETPLPAPAKKPTRCAVRGVKKAFGEQPILRGVDVEIPEGSFAVLVGSSGCGKSTLLRLVAGLEQADEGTIELAGRDVTALPPRDRDVAMVFQSYALYPHLTVRENLAFGLKLRGAAQSEVEARIKEASSMLSLDKLLDRLPKQLSGGQRQRVAMGRALVRRPTIFLFDEPLSNLDAALRAEVRVEIRRLHDRLGATTLYVTHDQVEAMTLADTLWVMNAGLVEQKGAPLEVYERPRTKFVAGFLGSPQMNLLEGALARRDGAWVVEGEGLVVPVDEARFDKALEEGRKVSFGLRPHDLGVARGGAPSIGELRVDIVEALGFEAFAHGWVRSSGPTLIVRLDGDDARTTRTGSTIRLAVPKDRVHLFDPKTGLSLDAS
jgi:sn-glycerol 3-phosphate transport system ATP-binding protein/multiple sugar transport system ATP-binding protein